MSNNPPAARDLILREAEALLSHWPVHYEAGTPNYVFIIRNLVALLKAPPPSSKHQWSEGIVNDCHVCERCGARWETTSEPLGPCPPSSGPPAEMHTPPAVHHKCGPSSTPAWCAHVKTLVDGAAQQDDYKCTGCGAVIITNISEWRTPDPPAPLTAVSPWEEVKEIIADGADGHSERIYLADAVDRARALSEKQHQQEIERIHRVLAGYLSPNNQNTRDGDIAAMIRDLAQAKISAQGNSETAEAALTEARADLARLTQAMRDLVDRISNGHPQSIGSINNVRMVQFGVEEIERYRAAIGSTESAESLDKMAPLHRPDPLSPTQEP